MRLRSEAVERIVMRLQGTYGQQFAGKFSRKENGVDVGVEMFKESLAVELAGFDSELHAIGYAMANLPADTVPNAIQLREICRRAPKKELPQLTYTYDQDKARKFAVDLAGVVNSVNRGSDPRFWATHPKSHLAFDYIRGAAANNPTIFQPCIDHLIAEGRVSEDGKHLLHKFVGHGQWGKA